ncbi:unnamed protein product [Didymodactylos carnosus]|uniref:Uncharacterized protein n=1 Tax=Didymodactylos carnosus TaxID=1234261 RepID=A0A814WH24_9BILA|nr:unnamed protein product [Didymodactylos carnosus]CAF3965821.1 unnamed protein product [Didymodactylos carnosus]
MATHDQASLLANTTPQKDSTAPPSVKRLRFELLPEDVRTTFIEALKSDLMVQRAVADIVQTNPDSKEMKFLLYIEPNVTNATKTIHFVPQIFVTISNTLTKARTQKAKQFSALHNEL